MLRKSPQTTLSWRAPEHSPLGRGRALQPTTLRTPCPQGHCPEIHEGHQMANPLTVSRVGLWVGLDGVRDSWQIEGGICRGRVEWGRQWRT